VYKRDYARVVAAHREHGADATLVTTRVAPDEASRFGVVQVAEDGRISDYAYKPESPASDLVATEVFLFEADALLDSLEQLADGADEASGLADLGDDLLPRLADEGRAREYRLDGYWRDVGTVESYWQAHMDLLEAEPSLRLDDPAWPILTRASQRPPARIESSARIERSLVSPGCTVRGRVVRSVLAPGVFVEEGAEVVDAVVLTEARIAASVSRAVVDMRAEVRTAVSGDDGIAVVDGHHRS